MAEKEKERSCLEECERAVGMLVVTNILDSERFCNMYLIWADKLAWGTYLQYMILHAARCIFLRGLTALGCQQAGRLRLTLLVIDMCGPNQPCRQRILISPLWQFTCGCCTPKIAERRVVQLFGRRRPLPSTEEGGPTLGLH
jgi:hypothetical protein